MIASSATSTQPSAAARSGETIRRVTWVGLVVNLLLSAFKFVAGVLGHSQAVVADAVHSLSDSTTDIAVLVGSTFWTRPPDANHPHGHRRIETIITIVIGLALAGVGVGIGWEALATLHEPKDQVPGLIALIAALVSIVTKEWLYRWTAAVGKRVKSPALVANAWHHRSDAFSSLPAALAVGGAALLPNWTFLDHVGAAVVSIFIVSAGFRILWPGVRELTDIGAPLESIETIARLARNTPSVIDVHNIRTRFVGAALQVDLHVVVDADMPVREAHEVGEEVSRRIRDEGPDVVDVIIHIDPEGHVDEEDDLFPDIGRDSLS